MDKLKKPEQLSAITIYAQCPEPICCNRGKFFCGRCLLVKYCSKDCQKAHFPVHKVECKKSIIKYEELYADYLLLELPSRIGSGPYITPTGQHEYYERLHKVFWDTTPRRDILNLAKNEGPNYRKKLDLCFATARDLGSVMNTINGLPSSYREQCTVVVNEYDLILALRNIIILVLALPNAEGDDTNETIIHLWYSASLTEGMYRQVIHTTSRLIEAFEEELFVNPGSATIRLPMEGFGKGGIQISLTASEINVLRAMMADYGKENGAENSEKHRRHAMSEDCNPELNRAKETWLASMPPAHRVVEKQYRDTGVLLPYGSSSEKFCFPNPTFYSGEECELGFLPRPTDSADLLRLAEFSKSHKLPENDVNGALYYSTRSMVDEFCEHLQRGKITIYAGCTRPSDLQRTLKAYDPSRDWGFDRIELGVAPYDGPPDDEDIAKFVPILKLACENPHATISLVTATEPPEIYGNDLRRAAQKLLPWRRICFQTGQTEEKLMRERYEAVDEMMDDANLNWRRLLKRQNWDNANIDATAKAYLDGIVMKDLDEGWPYQLIEETFSLEEFVLRLSGRVKGTERLVEWKRAFSMREE